MPLKNNTRIILISLAIIFLDDSQGFAAVQTVANGAGTVALAAGSGQIDGVSFTDGAGASPTVTVTDAQLVNSNNNAVGIAVSADNTGTMTFAGTSTVSGTVGSSTALDLLAINANGVAGKNVILVGNAFADAVTVDAGTLTVVASLTTTTINFTADGTLNMAASGTLTGTVTTNTNNTGTLSNGVGSTFNGQVGTSTNKLKLVSGSNVTFATFSNDVFATTASSGTGGLRFNGNFTGTTLNFAGDGTVTVASGKIITAATTTSTTNTGTLTFSGTTSTGGSIGAANVLKAVNFNGGTATLNNTIAATTTTVNSGATLQPSAGGGTTAITGALALAGTGILDVGTNSQTVSTTYNQASGTTLKVTVVSASSAGKLTSTGNATVNAGSKVSLNVAGYVPTGSAYTIVDGANASGTVSVPTSITSSSPLLSFTGATANGAGDLVVTANTNYNAASQTSNTTSVGTILQSLTSPSSDMTAVLTQLQALSTASQVEEAFEQLAPEVNQTVTQTSFTAMTESANTVVTHLTAVRSGAPSNKTGISSGDASSSFPFKNPSVWAKGFTNFANQGTRQGIHGYDSSLWGSMLGTDALISDNLRLGIAGSYANTDVNVKSEDSGTTVNSYQGTVYASYNPELYFVDNSFSFGYSQYDSSRAISFGSLNRTAKSKYHGLQYSGMISGGRDFTHQGFKITPLLSLGYSHLDLNSYTETEAGDLNLSVEKQSYDFLQSGLGLSLAHPFLNKQKKVTFIPEVHAKWLYDFIGDEQQATSTFTGGGASFKTNGFSPAQHSANLGAGLTLFSKNNITIEGVYDLELKQSYTGHSGTLTVRCEF